MLRFKPLQQMQYPICLRWRIKQEDAEKHYFLKTKKHIVKDFFDIRYCLHLFTAETHQDERGLTAVYLYVKPHKRYSVKAVFTLTLPTLKRTYNVEHIYDDAHDWGTQICRSDYFLDLRSPAFVNGEFIIEIKGMLYAGPALPRPLLLQNPIGGNLWDRNDKDFTLIADGKELKVHGNVLAATSEVFAQLLDCVDLNNECNRRLEVNDFSYETVEAAVKYCYQQSSHIDESNIANLCRFVDCYGIKKFKVDAEKYMMNTMDSINVFQYANASYYLHSPELEKRCIEFMCDCIKKKTVVIVENLHPSIYKKFFEYAFCNQLETSFD